MNGCFRLGRNVGLKAHFFVFVTEEIEAFFKQHLTAAQTPNKYAFIVEKVFSLELTYPLSLIFAPGESFVEAGNEFVYGFWFEHAFEFKRYRWLCRTGRAPVRRGILT